MKKILPINSFLLGIIFLTGCGHQPTNQIQQKSPVSSIQTPATNQPIDNQSKQDETLASQPMVDKTIDWQKFNYTEKGVSISVPKNWVNQSAANITPSFRDKDGKNQIDMSFHGDERAFNSTGKQVIENILSSASDKTADPLGEWVREDLNLGKNIVYKLYHPDYLKGLEGSLYDIRLKNDKGFVEFYVSQGSDEDLIKSIIEKVEIY